LGVESIPNEDEYIGELCYFLC